jgi:hypothetical protein
VAVWSRYIRVNSEYATPVSRTILTLTAVGAIALLVTGSASPIGFQLDVATAGEAAAGDTPPQQPDATEGGTPDPDRPQGICIAATLEQVGQAMTRLSRLDPACDVRCSIQGASRYLSDKDLPQPEALLFDKKTTGQGIFAAPETPITIDLEFVSRQRMQCIQLLYAGKWGASGIPGVAVASIEKDNELEVVGTMAAISTEPAEQPVIQQINFPNGNGNKAGQWRKLQLTIAGLPAEFGIVELRLIGYDEGVRGIGTALNQIARDPAAISVGNVSNIAVAVRSRRLAPAKRAAQLEAVHSLSRVISLLSGVFLELLIDTPAEGEEPAVGRFRIDNSSQKTLDRSILKLRLPAGWRAAPARHEVGEIIAGQCFFIPTSIYPAQTDELPTACLYGGYNGEPLFLMADIVGGFVR